MEKLAAPFELTETQPEEGTFTGLAAVYGREFDTWSGPLIIEPGAFSDSLKEDRDRYVVLWQHDEQEPIGRPVELQETIQGIHIKGRISQTTRGKDALTLLRDKVVREMSIGLDRLEEVKPKSGPTRLKRGKIWEFSLVTFGAAGGIGARVHEVHKAARAIDYPVDVRRAIGYAAELEAKYGPLPVPEVKDALSVTVRLETLQQGFAIQSVIFPKSKWDTAEAARTWAKDHDFRTDKVDETETSWRFRQAEPDDFDRLRTICINPGDVAASDESCRVQAVGGPRKS